MSTDGLSQTSSGDDGAVVTRKIVEHTGGCHCGAVRFKVKTADHLVVDKCNCSICNKKQISCFGATKEHFTLLQGEDNLTTYTFNTGTAKHMFCKTCGVQSFYVPRTNPTGFSVMPHCLDPGTVKSVTTEPYDGINWEQTFLSMKSANAEKFWTRMATEKVVVIGEGGASCQLVEHTGGCHCGAVRFRIKAPQDIVVVECNCSICVKKQIKALIIHRSNFTLLQGEDNLTTYTFNTGAAKHMFCKTCGVQSFYIPRCDPDGYCIVTYCLDPGTVKSVTLELFDGVNWEQSISSLDASKHLKSSV